MNEYRSEVDKGICIVLGQRGRVNVGHLFLVDGDWYVLKRAKNVRRWGTTKGLGQIAAEGPTKQTQLDMAGTVELHVLATVEVIRCNPERWEAVLRE